jgi:hypothetical protein
MMDIQMMLGLRYVTQKIIAADNLEMMEEIGINPRNLEILERENLFMIGGTAIVTTMPGMRVEQP